MKFLKVLLIAVAVPLAGCAAIESVGIGGNDDFENVSRNYNVFFGADSSEIDPAAQDVIDMVAQNAADYRANTIEILVAPEPIAGETINDIGERRVVAVENALAARGLDRAIFMRADLDGPTDVPDPALLRRVQIRLDFD